MNKKSLYIVIGSALVIILGLIWGLVFVASNSSDKGADTNDKDNSFTPTQLERSLSGKPVEEDREDVYNAAVALLESTNAPEGQEEFMKLLDDVDKIEASAIPEEFLAKVRFVDIMDDDALRITSYQSAITFASLAKSAGEGKITALQPNAGNNIFVDQEAGIAHLPMSIFMHAGDQPNTFSMEFVYVDGEWLMSPYSMLDQLRLSLSMQQQMLTMAEGMTETE